MPEASSAVGPTVGIILVVLIILVLILVGVGYLVQSSIIFSNVTATKRLHLEAGEVKSVMTLTDNQVLTVISGRPSADGTVTFGFNDGSNYSEDAIYVEGGKLFYIDRTPEFVLNRTEVTVIADNDMVLCLGLKVEQVNS